MATDDRIQPPAGSTPAPSPTNVAATPPTPTPAVASTATTATPPAPAHTAPAVPNPITTRALEIYQQAKPYVAPWMLYLLGAIVLAVGGYFLIDYLFFDKAPNSHRWEEWTRLNTPSEIRKATEEVKKKETPPPPGTIEDQEYRSYLVYKQMLEEFAKKCPDTTQERVARIQLGRYLMILALRDLTPATSPSRSAEMLETVRKTFTQVEPQLESEPILQEEVNLIRAQVEEMLGDLKKAEELYHKLADSEKSKNGAAGKTAAASLERLKDPKNREEAIAQSKKYFKPS